MVGLHSAASPQSESVHPIRELTCAGLYYKLHGSHRPVEMKKQEIKRRKRIVPADGTSTHAPSSIASYSPQPRATQTPAFEHSVSPDPSTAIIESSELPLGVRPPVPVDFTTYQISTTHLGPPSPSTTYAGVPSPRKRSLSATLDVDEKPSTPAPHRPNPISSILNPAAAHDTNIDPSLSSLSQQSAESFVASQEDKAARKERLRREAEMMRVELARRERELRELGDD